MNYSFTKSLANSMFKKIIKHFIVDYWLGRYLNRFFKHLNWLFKKLFSLNPLKQTFRTLSKLMFAVKDQ